MSWEDILKRELSPQIIEQLKSELQRTIKFANSVKQVIGRDINDSMRSENDRQEAIHAIDILEGNILPALQRVESSMNSIDWAKNTNNTEFLNALKEANEWCAKIINMFNKGKGYTSAWVGMGFDSGYGDNLSTLRAELSGFTRKYGEYVYGEGSFDPEYQQYMKDSGHGTIRVFR